MGSLWSKIAQTAGAKIYSLVIGVIVLAVTARWLGPEGRGQYAALITWVGTFATIGHLSLGQVAIREASSSLNDRWLHDSFSSLLFWAVITILLCLICALGLYYYTEGSLFGDLQESLLILVCAMLPFMLWEKHGRALLMALERLDVYNRYQIIGKSLGLFVLLLLIFGFGVGVEGVVVATITGQVVIAGGGFLMLWRLAGAPRLFNWDSNIKFLKGGLSLHLNAIGVCLFSATDLLMLNYYHGAEETG